MNRRNNRYVPADFPRRRRGRLPRQLRQPLRQAADRPATTPALELVLFGMTVTFFVTIHYRLVQLRVAEGDRVMLMATIKNTVLFIFAVIVLYGMFIPNTWRRAAAVIGVMVAATLLSPLALRVLHPEVFRLPPDRPRPFTGPTAMAVMIVVVRDPVEPPSRHRPDLPPDLERVVLRCLAKSPPTATPTPTTSTAPLPAAPPPPRSGTSPAPPTGGILKIA